MIECPTHDVHAAVDDTIDLRADGSVYLERRISFFTDSETSRAFRYFHREELGGKVSLDAEVVTGADPSALVVLPGHAEDYLVVELIAAEVSSSTSVAIVVRSELVPPSRATPIEYSVEYAAPLNVHYSVAVRPYMPELTEDVRFEAEVLPASRTEKLYRDAGSGEVHLGSSVRVSNATEPFRLRCVHAEDLPSTRLLTYYRQKFAR